MSTILARLADRVENAFPVGDNIARARFIANITQGDLAERVGVARETIAEWERGKRKPRRRSLDRLTGALSILLLDRLVERA